MELQKIASYNDISPELLALVPELKKGQVVRFKMLNGAKNMNPDTKERERQPVIYPKSSIHCRDRIIDGKRSINIGIIKETSDDGKRATLFEMLIPWFGQNPFVGRFVLVGGRGKDSEIFTYLMLCNENKSSVNPNRDTDVPALFEVIDLEKEAKATNKYASSLRKALSIAEDMSLAEKQELAASLNWSSDFTDEMLDSKINELIMLNGSDGKNTGADQFLKMAIDPSTKVKAIIKQASDMEVISYDQATGKVTMGSGRIAVATLDKPEGISWLDVFADWIKTHKNGKKVFENIKAQLKVTNQLQATDEPVDE